MVAPRIILAFIFQSPWFQNLFWLKSMPCVMNPSVLTKVTEEPTFGVQLTRGFTYNRAFSLARSIYQEHDGVETL